MSDNNESVSSVIAVHSFVHRFNAEGSCDLVLGIIHTIGLITVVLH